MFIISDSWDGKTRNLYSHLCLSCAKQFFAPLKANAKYCSRECMGLHRRTRVKVSCFRCFEKFERQLNKVREINYCSRKCKEEDQQIGGPLALPHYGDGVSEYRNRALRQYGKKCNSCNFDEEERMLDVHHKDSNRANGNIDNLEVLCVWCHALITRKVNVGRVA